MNTKQKLAYIAIGGLLVAAGIIISPLNATIDKFGDMECTKLTVRGPDGQQRVKITADNLHGGRVLKKQANMYQLTLMKRAGV